MNPIYLKRLCSIDTLCLKKVLQCTISRSYSSKSNKQSYHNKTGLDAVVTSISSHMKQQGKIERNLLVLDNPASGEVVKKFKKAGVKKIACTIRDEDHFSKIQEQLPSSKHIFHYDLLRTNKKGTMKLSRAVEKEEQILSSIENISGLTILSSGVSNKEKLDIHRSLINRTMTREADGFCRLHQIDWFFALSERSIKVKKHLQSSHTVVTLLNSFYEYQTGISIKYDDTSSIFHTDIDSKKLHQISQSDIVGHQRKVSTIKQNDVCFVHFMPKFDVLRQFDLDERQAYRTFIRLISGPQRLIPALEKLVPGCGLGLIELGYGMADEVNQIPREQFLQVYKDVISLPEYDGSALHHLLAGKEVHKEEADYFDIAGQWWSGQEKR
ncbi:uncharacterized protein LOC123526374 isoform X2 [Mercenaria mercenaria]|nr:uncharacterized protein LOC123526374 isoform X2 [Mercenaria mercenaria]XP_053376705.1 uncharacterized protein LOC123526374 isoform X2 [Mercenaria mercenaria]